MSGVGEDLAPTVFRYRIILNFEGQAENVSTDKVIEELIK